MKIVRGVLIGVLVLVVLVLLAVWIFINPLVKTGIEKGGTFALEVDTTVDKVSVGLVSGRLTIDDLNVANPEGFETSHLMTCGHFDLGLSPWSLMGDTVEVSRFEIKGLDINIEQKLLKNNVSTVLKSLGRFQKSDDGDKEEEEKKDDKKPQGQEAPGGKRIKVDRVLIDDVQVHVTVSGPAGLGESRSFGLDKPIELEGVTDENAQGLLVHELVARLVPRILAEVIKRDSKGVIPGDLKQVLGGDLDGTLKAFGTGIKDRLEKGVTDPAGTVGDAIKEGNPLKQNPLGGGLKKLIDRDE